MKAIFSRMSAILITLASCAVIGLVGCGDKEEGCASDEEFVEVQLGVSATASFSYNQVDLSWNGRTMTLTPSTDHTHVEIKLKTADVCLPSGSTGLLEVEDTDGDVWTAVVECDSFTTDDILYIEADLDGGDWVANCTIM